MGKKRTSIVWSEDRDSFQERVNNCSSIADIVRSLGMAVAASNYRTVYKRIQEDNINIAHISLGIDSNKGRTFATQRKHASNYLHEGSAIQSYDLKHKLFRDNILDEKCSECGLGPTWNNKPISLHLDHINGMRTDNRLENLRILCPNCHSQTPTYSGKHKGKKCISCGKQLSGRKYTRCLYCSNEYNLQNTKRKFDISRDELEKIVWEMPTTQIASMFGVSDKTIEKRCAQLNISKPPRGYWQKNSASKKVCGPIG